MINSIISFKQIPIVNYKKEDGEIKIVSPYTLPQKYDRDVFVKIKTEDFDDDEFKIQITDGQVEIASNDFRIFKEEKVLKNAGMDVWDKNYRGKGFGVVMHLNSVIEVLENDLDRIDLYSMAEAVLFHGKCKFVPNFHDRDSIEEALYQISLKDYKNFPRIESSVDKAVKYLNEIFLTGGINCLNRDKLKYAQDIVTEYIEAVNTKKLTSEERQEYGFATGFDMVLTKDRILENKDFFNNLFKKYHIDYEI